jgi:hypothetical protein
VLQSRRWIESESDAVSRSGITLGDGVDRPESCAQVTLSPQQLDRLNQCAAATGLDREVVLSRLVGAALADPERFDRFDRHRLRRCIDLLRAIEVHVARAARSIALRRLPPDLTARRVEELLDLGRYLRRVGSVLLPLPDTSAAPADGSADIRGQGETPAQQPAASDS